MKTKITLMLVALCVSNPVLAKGKGRQEGVSSRSLSDKKKGVKSGADASKTDDKSKGDQKKVQSKIEKINEKYKCNLCAYAQHTSLNPCPMNLVV